MTKRWQDAPPPVPFSKRSRAFHGEPPFESAYKRARWAKLQAEWARQGQRDFSEVWTETNPPRKSEADGSRDPASPASACPVAGPRKHRVYGENG